MGLKILTWGEWALKIITSILTKRKAEGDWHRREESVTMEAGKVLK
jgi:hypothetical protein